MINRATLLGRLGKDPEVRYTSGGKSVAGFSLATSEKVKKGDEWVENTEWHNVVAWGKAAERAGTMHKGDLVFVDGRIQTRKWQDRDQNTRYTTEVVATHLVPVQAKDTAPKPPKQEAQQEEFGFDPNDDIPF